MKTKTTNTHIKITASPLHFSTERDDATVNGVSLVTMRLGERLKAGVSYKNNWTLQTTSPIIVIFRSENMKADIPPSWLAMSERRLHAYLVHRNYPPEMVKKTVMQVVAIKAARRAERIKRSMQDNRWVYLLTPARDELGVVRTMKAQTKRQLDEEFGNAGTQAKLDALTIYDAVIAKTIEFLRKVQRACEHTPLQFADELRANNQMPTAGRGDHWTDYIKAKDRKAVLDAFAKVPDPARGKKKIPFERRISVTENAERRDKLWKTIQVEQEMTQQEHDMASNPFDLETLAKKLDDLQEATYRLETLPKTATVPATWHGLIGRKPE